MRGFYKLMAVLIMMLATKLVFASSDSPTMNFKLSPGGIINLPLDILFYNQYYNISCNVKDGSLNGDAANGIHISSVYRPHQFVLDGKPLGWHSQITLKTNMGGSNFVINNVSKYNDKITIESLDFTDTIEFVCIGYLIDNS